MVNDERVAEGEGLAEEEGVGVGKPGDRQRGQWHKQHV